MNNDEIANKAYNNSYAYNIKCKYAIMKVVRKALRLQAEQIFKELEEKGKYVNVRIGGDDNQYYILDDLFDELKKKWCGNDFK